MDSTTLRIVLSLTDQSSAYQLAEASAAQSAARRLGFSLEVIFAGGDAILQSNKLIDLIFHSGFMRPDVIIVEPVGSGMKRVALEAARAGIGWVVINRDVDYIAELRSLGKAPCFAVSTDHAEAGRIQGRQLNALMPKGGAAILLQGPSSHPVANARTAGLQQTKAQNIEVRTLIGNWQEETATEAVSSWLKMQNAKKPAVIAAHNDFMALGARKACSKVSVSQPAAAGIKCIGCDGLAEHGRQWTSTGQLNATIVCPSLSELALEYLAKWRSDDAGVPPKILAQPASYPELRMLA